MIRLFNIKHSLLSLIVSTTLAFVPYNNGNANIIEYIGAIFTPPPSLSPLMKASIDGDVKKIKKLLSQGANIEEKSEYGYTALMFAISKGHKDVIIELLHNGASLDIITKRIARNTQAPTPKYTPLSLALSIRERDLTYPYERNYPSKPQLKEKAIKQAKNYEQIAYILLENGSKIDEDSLGYASRVADINMLNLMYQKHFQIPNTPFDRISIGSTSNYAFFNRRGGMYVSTPLCEAARSGDLETVKWLIHKNADPNYISHCSPLHSASNLEVTEYLLSIGADPNLGANLQRKFSALEHAIISLDNVWRNNEITIEKIKYYLTYGANPHTTLEGNRFKGITIKQFLSENIKEKKDKLAALHKRREEKPNEPYYGPSEEQYQKSIHDMTQAISLIDDANLSENYSILQDAKQSCSQAAGQHSSQSHHYYVNGLCYWRIYWEDKSKKILIGQAIQNYIQSINRTVNSNAYIQHSKLGLAYKELGLYELALREYNGAMGAGFEVPSRFMKARIYSVQGRIDQAIEEFTYIERVAPEKIKIFIEHEDFSPLINNKKFEAYKRNLGIL